MICNVRNWARVKAWRARSDAFVRLGDSIGMFMLGDDAG